MVACAGPPATASPSSTASLAERAVRYVALGDSYTIGTGVTEPERFPNQLVRALAGDIELELVANLGVNGYSSADLIRHQLPALDELAPEFVSLLIGVNDVVRGVPPATYRANVVHILDTLLGRLPADRIVVVSVPDYTRTPAGGSFGDPLQQRAAIVEANATMAAEAAARGVAFVDISAVADRVGTEPGLVAADRLHPSGEQYDGWVELITPVVRELFGAGA